MTPRPAPPVVTEQRLVALGRAMIAAGSGGARSRLSFLRSGPQPARAVRLENLAARAPHRRRARCSGLSFAAQAPKGLSRLGEASFGCAGVVIAGTSDVSGDASPVFIELREAEHRLRRAAMGGLFVPVGGFRRMVHLLGGLQPPRSSGSAECSLAGGGVRSAAKDHGRARSHSFSSESFALLAIRAR
jgi:hypothetical protein